MYTAVAVASAHRDFDFMLTIFNRIIVVIIRLYRSATPADSWEHGE